MKQLLAVVGHPAVDAALRTYPGVHAMISNHLGMVDSMVGGAQPIDAVILDDSRSTMDALWATVARCRAHHLGVYLLLYGPGRDQALDFQDAGCDVCTASDPAAQLAWLEQRLSLRARAAREQMQIAVASAKGGVGKSELIASLGYAAQLRGLQTVIVDGDVANGSVRGQFGFTTEPSFLRVTEFCSVNGRLTPDLLQAHAYPHAPTGLHALLAPESMAEDLDVKMPDWKVAMQVLRKLPFDLALIDTPPEIVRRPYAWEGLRDGGAAVIPLPPGRRERTGAAMFLHWVKNQDPRLLQRCFLVPVMPERGSVAGAFLRDITANAQRAFPGIHVVAQIPRDPKLLSLVSEAEGPYRSPLELAPNSAYTRAIHQIFDTLCTELGMAPLEPMPKPSWFARLFHRNRQVTLPAPSLPSLEHV